MKVALVTGGGRGIGAAIARRLGKDGARVVVLDRERTPLAAEIGALDVDCDLTDMTSIEAALSRVKREAGDVSILVQNAGIGESAPFTKTTDEMWNRAMALNATAAFRVARAIVPEMVAAKWGRVVNVASIAGLVGQAYVSAYCASKHALVGLTRAMAAELAKTGVTVNCVCPGFVDTEMTAKTIANIVGKTKRTPEEAKKILEDMNPQKRLVLPEEVADCVAMLCSEGARSINGQAIEIDGGQLSEQVNVMTSQIVSPPNMPKPRGYADGLIVPSGRLLFISGQIAWDKDARIVSPDFATQFLAALDNVINVVRAAGGGTQHIVKLLAFVTDLDAYRGATKSIGEGWRTRMGKYYPAMSLVKVAGLLEPGALVEIEGQAVLP